jgi:hypothetical protein
MEENIDQLNACDVYDLRHANYGRAYRLRHHCRRHLDALPQQAPHR